MKVSIVSLGCSKNLVDSELIVGDLKKRGHEFTEVENAETIILNTCGFIGDAKKESINTAIELLEYKKNGNCKKLILTGCLIERYSEQLKREMPEIDAFWGTGNLSQIHKLLDDEPENFKNYKPGTLYDPDSPRELLTSSHTAYVKVSEGCSRTCTFCIIPKMRGLMKSRKKDSVKKEISNLADNGVKEINLIAQDMTSYGRDISTNLEELLLEISSVEKVEWIRLHYLYPWGFTDSLMKVINNEQRIVPYIDMPLQHINDRLLKLMDRRTTKEKTIDIIERLRANIEDLTLRSTFIVGFPGETEKEFEELLDFIEKYKFERAGAFKYSQEEGTGAATLEGQIAEDIKEERLETLMNLQSEVSYGKNNNIIGTKQWGIIEGLEDGTLYARLSSQAPEVDGITYVDSDNEDLIGDIVNLKITGCDVYDLYAKLDY
ncbi:MAG: 30S ribosomal protein S12 methylthiotransferase RimO [Thermodesulfobacteriota bacterium]